MKKLIVVAAAIAWAGIAFAGEYHVYDTLKCSQCHTMHASRTHGFSGATPDSQYPLTAQGTGHEKLLTYATVNETCLSCHNGTKGPDVYGAATAMDRSAGLLNGTVANQALGVLADGTVPADYMGHSMGAKVAPPGWTGDAAAWNGATAAEFECSDCHGVHGTTSFRNLVNTHGRVTFTATPVVSYQIGGAFDPTYDVNVVSAANSDKTVDVQFGLGGVANYKGSATTPVNNMNAVCASCHGSFHGANTLNAAGNLVRHPTSGVTFAATGLIASAPTALVRPSYTAADKSTFEVACLTCHKGHGNGRGFALMYPGVIETATYGAKATGAPIVDYENGDGVKDSRGSYPIRNLCITCHSQGRTKR